MASKSCHPLGNSKRFHRVLAYLRSMVQYCRDERHRDMEYEYELAIRFASAHVYGKLPPKKDWSALIKWEPTPPDEIPKWKRDILAKPMRRVVDRVTESDEEKYELLECGHRNYVYDFDGWSEAEPHKQAKWRRCKECRDIATQKKPAQSEPASRDAFVRYSRERFKR